MMKLTKKLYPRPLRLFWQLQELGKSVWQHQRLLTTLFKLAMQKEQNLVAVVAVVVMVKKCK
jgi:hypothetical protein